MKIRHAAAAYALFALSQAVHAAEPATLNVTVSGIDEGTPIAEKYAYCVLDGSNTTRDGGNINPKIIWSGAPAGTKSYALIMVDHDVPADFGPANKPGKTIAEQAPRQDFYHWVLLNIPADITGIDEGTDSKGVVAGGKPNGKTAHGLSGQNDFVKTGPGPHGGYDGPCPPWNDMRMHRYHFNVYALDIAEIAVPQGFNGKQAMDAIEGHILAKGTASGIYSNNPAMNKKINAKQSLMPH